MVETLVHAPDYKKALKELRRVLKPGGKLVLDEYSKSPRDELSANQNAVFDELIDLVAMPSFNYFLHDQFPAILLEAGFTNIAVENISGRIVPMTKSLYNLAIIFYPAIKLLHLQKHFVNNLWGVYHYRFNKSGAWRFNIISAKK